VRAPPRTKQEPLALRRRPPAAAPSHGSGPRRDPRIADPDPRRRAPGAARARDPQARAGAEPARARALPEGALPGAHRAARGHAHRSRRRLVASPTPPYTGRVSSLPTGTVTLLFTDIESSTRLVQELGDTYTQVLSDHRRLVRDAVAEA